MSGKNSLGNKAASDLPYSGTLAALYKAELWKWVLVVLVIIGGSTLLEYWGYRKHHQAQAELTKQSRAAKIFDYLNTRTALPFCCAR